MQFHAHFILLNADFNQSIADDFNNGEESEDNIKHLWEDELKVNEAVKEYKINHHENYILKGFYPNNEAFHFEIPNVTIVNCTSVNNKLTQFVVSKKLIKKTDKTENAEKTETHFYFYLRDELPFVNPIDGIYILKSDFPKRLTSA